MGVWVLEEGGTGWGNGGGRASQICARGLSCVNQSQPLTRRQSGAVAGNHFGPRWWPHQRAPRSPGSPPLRAGAAGHDAFNSAARANRGAVSIFFNHFFSAPLPGLGQTMTRLVFHFFKDPCSSKYFQTLGPRLVTGQSHERIKCKSLMN